MKGLSLLALSCIFTFPAFAQPAAGIEKMEWQPASALRVGNSINSLYRIWTSTGQTTDLWLKVDCQSGVKTQLFAEVSSPAGKAVRVYGSDAISRYAPGVVIEPDADSLLATQPDLNVCRQQVAVPQWRALAPADEQGNQMYLDVSRSERSADVLHLRLAKDFALEYRDSTYAAPYAVKVTDWTLHCDTQQATARAEYSLDSAGNLTDYRLAANSSTELAAPLKQQLCAIKTLRDYQGSGQTLLWQQKAPADHQLTLPDFSRNDAAILQPYPLPDEVKEHMAIALNSPQQQPGFRHLSFSQQQDKEIGGAYSVTIDKMPDGTTLTLEKLTLGQVTFNTQSVRLFNLVSLKKRDSLAKQPSIARTLENEFRLPPRAGMKYAWSSQQSDGKSLGQQCRTAADWKQASTINPAFPGRYLEFNCIDDRGDGKSASSDYAYLERLRIFIRIGYQEQRQKRRFTFEDVVVKY